MLWSPLRSHGLPLTPSLALGLTTALDLWLPLKRRLERLEAQRSPHRLGHSCCLVENIIHYFPVKQVFGQGIGRDEPVD